MTPDISTSLLLTVFGASVAGSLHCVGMCGPLMACAVATPGQTQSKAATLGPGFGAFARRNALQRSATHTGYHVARGVGYIALGGVAGGVGALLDVTSALAGAVPIAGALAGLCLIVIALAGLSHAMGWGFRRVAKPTNETRLNVLQRTLQSLQRKALALPPALRATVLGTLTPLLPCGWLYAFVLIAAGTGSVFGGLSVMTAFWLGTLPALVALGVGLQGSLAALRQRLPKLTAWATAAAMLFIGVTMFTGRLGIDPSQLALATEAQAAQRESDQITPTADETPACCPLMEAAAKREGGDTP
ncbi:MAG: sulfite exporter TauE/SafE family protein [Planctomycetota bacterium]